MEKAIEIKRRAQRCILNGDLDGALHEYEKLIASGDNDPYHSVLLADLLYKKGEHEDAGKRYLDAVLGYENVGLVRNAIAICKKMTRLSLSPGAVLQRLAALHARDGLVTESSLYYMQHAELQLSHGQRPDAERSLREAFQVCRDNVRALERLAEVQEQGDDRQAAAGTWFEAAAEYERLGQLAEGKRCRARAEALVPGSTRGPESPVRASSAVRETDPATASFSHRVEPFVQDAPAPPVAEPMLEIVGRETPSPPTDGPVLEIVGRESLSPEVLEAPEVVARGEESAAAFQQAPPVAASTPERPGVAAVETNGDRTVGEDASNVSEVSEMLNQAQVLFRQGERKAASATLVKAAQSYDRFGKYDNAAAIYRSLSQANEAPLQVMMLWLKNCQRRDDGREAARVACELGDRALLDGDAPGAREWFERARSFDADNSLAARRLQRLAAPGGEPLPRVPVPSPVELPRPVAAETVSAGPGVLSPGPQGIRDGMVQLSLDNDEPVGMDLGEMIAEFQRGLEEQLDSDPQGNYDLGMSYREMGLFDHAVVSFRSSAQAPAFRARASEMIGRCLLDQGDFDGAAEELVRTLEHMDPHSSAVNDIRYQLGLAFEAGGRLEEALGQFGHLYADEPNYPGVASKIRTLRMATEREG